MCNGSCPREHGPNSRCHRREAAGGAAGPGVRSRPPRSPSSPFLSSSFTNFSHIPAACAPAAGLARRLLPCIVCAASDDPRRPEGLRSPEARDPHAPRTPLPSPHLAQGPLVDALGSGRSWPPPGLSLPTRKGEDPVEGSPRTHSSHILSLSSHYCI